MRTPGRHPHTPFIPFMVLPPLGPGPGPGPGPARLTSSALRVGLLFTVPWPTHCSTPGGATHVTVYAVPVNPARKKKGELFMVHRGGGDPGRSLLAFASGVHATTG